MTTPTNSDRIDLAKLYQTNMRQREQTAWRMWGLFLLLLGGINLLFFWKGLRVGIARHHAPLFLLLLQGVYIAIFLVNAVYHWGLAIANRQDRRQLFAVVQPVDESIDRMPHSLMVCGLVFHLGLKFILLAFSYGVIRMAVNR